MRSTLGTAHGARTAPARCRGRYRAGRRRPAPVTRYGAHRTFITRTLRGGQHGRQAAPGRHDLSSRPWPAPRPIDDGRRPTFRRPSRRPRPTSAAGPTWQSRLRPNFPNIWTRRNTRPSGSGRRHRRRRPPTNAAQKPRSEAPVRIDASRACVTTPTPRRRCVGPAGGSEGIPRSGRRNQGV